MVLPHESEEQLYRKLLELCGRLNLDPNHPKTIECAWDSFRSIHKNFVLEGEALHWLGCAVYVATQTSEPSGGQTNAKGGSFSLTSLLRHSNLSFVYFFHNIRKWAEMAHLPSDFRKRIDHLEDTFGVTHNTFKEYYPLFSKVFCAPNIEDLEHPKFYRVRKQRLIPCNSSKVFEFVWNLFITLKADSGRFSTDLIKSYHLMYSCLDLAFMNAYMDGRKDLINMQFEGLPPEWHLPGLPTKTPCIMKYLCRAPAMLTDAMHTKVYLLRTLLQKFMKNASRKTLLMDFENFTGLLDKDNFEQNFKSVAGAYESYMVNRVDIDERIFIAEYRRRMLQPRLSSSNVRIDPGESSVMESPGNPENPVMRGSDTPLTGRRFIGPREADMSPPTDRSIAQKISKMNSMLKDRTPGPSKTLLSLFENCQNDPQSRIQAILQGLSDKFSMEYVNAKQVEEDEVNNKLQSGMTLFYKLIENILLNEKNIREDISAVVENDTFYCCMFACSLESVLFSHSAELPFPWILKVLDVQAFHFVKVIELSIRSSDLPRELVKHLSKVEETILESLIWKSDSQLWEAIQKSGASIPKFEDTALPGHFMHKQNEQNVIKKPNNVDGFLSPTPSAVDRFQSPVSEQSKQSGIQAGRSMLQGHTHIMISDKDGNKKLIPIVDGTSAKPDQSEKPPSVPVKSKRMGSVSIIFRKVYHLAGVRLEHLFSKLNLDDFELKQKIWTVLEESIRSSDLIKDRHLDQLLMCAIYVICRISNIPLMFQDIMKFYREQPQATSSVYREVLLARKQMTEFGETQEKHGDLIYFYNNVYVEIMQKTAVKFRNDNEASSLFLSPLPAIKRNLVSPSVQVFGNVHVKPLEGPLSIAGPSLNYFFSRSPSKDLKEINKFVNNGGGIRKRLLVENDSDSVPSSKRFSNKKVQLLMEERKNQNAE